MVFVATAAVEFDNSHSEKRNCWLSRKKEPLTPHNTILNDAKVKLYSHVFISHSEVYKNCCKITVKLIAKLEGKYLLQLSSVDLNDYQLHP